MNLIELLAITDENTNIYIHQDSNIVSQYDSRNSIDEQYNDKEVYCMYTEKTNDNELHIEISL